MEWSKDQVLDLIALFREKPVLWDQTCPEFKSRIQKNYAWTKIAREMKLNKAEVQSKMKKLIGQHQRETKKVKYGSGIETVKSKWYAFDSLQFLNHKTIPCHTRETGLSENTSETNTPHQIQNSQQIEGIAVQTSGHITSKKDTDPPVNAPIRTNKRSYNLMAEEAYVIMKQLGENIKQKDEFDVFGEHVACQIRKFRDVRDQIIAKHRINQILFDLEMSQFTQRSNSNLPSHSTWRTSTATPTMNQQDSTNESVPIFESLCVVEGMGLDVNNGNNT